MAHTPIIIFLSVVALAPCFAGNASLPGPQPYLLFNVITSDRFDARMLSAQTTEFTYSARSHDGSVTMHAKLLEKTSKGFRFSWSVVHSLKGKVVARIRERLLVPWSADFDAPKSLNFIPGYHAKVFYSRVPLQPPVTVQ